MSVLKIKDGDGNWVSVPSIKGEDGHTPVKGADYWTAADKAEIVSDVLAALPTYDGSVQTNS